MPKSRPAKRVLKFWEHRGEYLDAAYWKFRLVRCNHCGLEWNEIVEPRRYAQDLSCACNLGEPWSPDDG